MIRNKAGKYIFHLTSFSIYFAKDCSTKAKMLRKNLLQKMLRKQDLFKGHLIQNYKCYKNIFMYDSGFLSSWNFDQTAVAILEFTECAKSTPHCCPFRNRNHRIGYINSFVEGFEIAPL